MKQSENTTVNAVDDKLFDRCVDIVRRSMPYIEHPKAIDAAVGILAVGRKHVVPDVFIQGLLDYRVIRVCFWLSDSNRRDNALSFIALNYIEDHITELTRLLKLKDESYEP